ncbi:MAG: TolC family outer membrane protein [Pseudomonadota bacterium]
MAAPTTGTAPAAGTIETAGYFCSVACRLAHRVVLAVVVAAATFAASPGAMADTLTEALAAAYRFSPTIQAERKALEATDEQVPLAKSNYHPRIVVRGDVEENGSASRNRLSAGGNTSDRRTTGGYDIQVTSTLFRGFRTLNQIRQAEARVLAGRETLREVEQRVLLEAVTAYMDVVRDRGIVRLRRNDVQVLSEEVRATTIRFDAGDATRTDVAQARARRAGAVAALDLARANLRASEAEYRRVTGQAPGRLTPPRLPDHLLPKNVTGVIDRAQGEAPPVIRAAFLERAAQHEVDIIRGELLPTLDLEAGAGSRFNSSELNRQFDEASIGARVTVPLYQGGAVFARVRAARRLREQAARQIEEARLRARADAVTAWSRYTASKAQLVSVQAQVRSNQIALAGVRAEERVGQRTLLDVLDAKQELLLSQSDLLTTRRDIVVAAYAVLSSMGALTVADIGLGVQQHDPELHYDLVRDKAWGTIVVPNEAYDGYVVDGVVLD